MPQITKYPGTLQNIITYYDQWGNPRERLWIGLDNLKASANVATCGDNTIASSLGTVHKPAQVRATNYGFSIPDNCRINWLRGEWSAYTRNPSGGFTGNINIPRIRAFMVAANNGANTPIRTDEFRVPSSAQHRSLTFSGNDISNCSVADVNSSSFGFHYDPYRNISGNTGRMYNHYLRITVDYSLPTYSLNGTITSSVVVGEEVNYSLTLTNTNNTPHNTSVPVNISIPAGLSVKSSSGHGSYSAGVWNAVIQSNGTATLNLVFDTSTSGFKTVGAEVDGFNVTFNRTVNVLEPTYSLTSDIADNVIQGENIIFEVEVGVNSDVISNVEVNVPEEDYLSFVSSSGDGSYNNGTGVWTASFSNRKSTRSFTFTATIAGEHTYNINTIGVSNDYPLLIVASNVSDVFYLSIPFPEEVRNLMVDGKDYGVYAFFKPAHTGWTDPFEGDKNFRIGVDRGDGHKWFGSRWSLSSFTRRWTVLWNYQEAYIPSLLVMGNYYELSPEEVEVEFAGVEIRERLEGFRNQYSPPDNVYDDPNLLLVDSDYTTINIPSNENTLKISFSDFNWSGHDLDPDLIIREVIVSGDIDTPTNLMGIVQLESGGKIATDSSLITSSEDSFEIGTRKWGLNTVNLDDLEFNLYFTNLSGSGVEIGLKNIEIQIKYKYDITKGNLGFSVDGTHSREFDVFLEPGFDKPEGLMNELNALELERTDGEFLLSSTVRAKEFSIPFKIIANNLESAEALSREIGEWLSTQRTLEQIPLTKELVFDWDHDRKYNVIMEEPLEKDFEDYTYNLIATFRLPDGVGWTDEKVTGGAGRNNGLVGVRPIIRIVKSAGVTGPVTLEENVSGQKMVINEDFFSDTATIDIDCIKRSVDHVYSDTSWADKVSFDSDWFYIRGEYDFNVVSGGVVLSVRFKEGV